MKFTTCIIILLFAFSTISCNLFGYGIDDMNGKWYVVDHPSNFEIKNNVLIERNERPEYYMEGNINWLNDFEGEFTITKISANYEHMLGATCKIELIKVTKDFLQLRLNGLCIYMVKVLDYKDYNTKPCKNTAPNYRIY